MRDGLSFHEASESLRTNLRIAQTDDQLWRLYCLLPARPRRRSGSFGEACDFPAPGPSPDEAVCRPDASLARVALSRAQLSPEDRVLVELRFARGLRLVRIAHMHGLDQKALYRRLAAILRQLRLNLQTQGLIGSDLLDAVGHLEELPRSRSVLPFRK